jgi:DNA-binding NarL/FixJ family response regulator
MVLLITPWERTALQLLAAGLTIHEMARRFEMAEAELERQLASLFGRLGTTTAAEALTTAARRGLLSNDLATAPAGIRSW